MRLHDGFHWIPLLPPDMREQLAGFPRDKKQWPKAFREAYARQHADFTAAKDQFVEWAARDRHRLMTKAAKAVLAYLVRRLNFNTGRCDPSQKTIADDLDMGLRSVERAIKSLSDAGWVEVSRRGKTVPNFYRLRISTARLDAIKQDFEDRRQLRNDARKARRFAESDPPTLADHSADDPSKMTGHEPPLLAGHEPPPVAGKPMKGTSEGEPLNENKITEAKEGTYTGEGIPSEESEFRSWISSNIPDRTQHREAYRLLRERKMTPELWRRMAA